MKLHDRFAVEGTNPLIYIGHREFKDKQTGKMTVARSWHAEWNHDGKKFDESLKTTNKQEAIRAANRIIDRIERGDIRHVHRRVEWHKFKDEYMDSIRNKRRAPKTITKYEQIIDRFISFMKEERNCRWPEKTTPADFWAFGAHLAKNHELCDGSIEDNLTLVKQIYKWATFTAKPPLLTINPIAGEVVPEAEDAPQPCFDPEQVAMLLAKADDHHRPIWAVMAYLGLRFGEVRDLRWSDFDFKHGKNGWVNIQRGGSGDKTKGKKSRRIPLHPELRKILDALPHHEDGLLFHQQPSLKYPEGGRPLNPDKLLKSIKRLCKRCQFENPKQYKQHTFRHAFASMLARNNVPYKQALEWMGHQDSAILDLYIKLFDKDAERHIDAIVYPADSAA